MTRLFLPLAGVAMLAGCHDQHRPGMPSPVRCDANNVHVTAEMRSPAVEAKAKRQAGARAVRWLTPGSAVTMDFRIDRLNLSVDERGKITGARCG